jgi:hypothetical protein
MRSIIAANWQPIYGSSLDQKFKVAHNQAVGEGGGVSFAVADIALPSPMLDMRQYCAGASSMTSSTTTDATRSSQHLHGRFDRTAC